MAQFLLFGVLIFVLITLTMSAPDPNQKALLQTMEKYLRNQPNQRLKRQSAYKRPGLKKELFEGDIVLQQKNLDGMQREATIRELIWTDGVIPYTIEITDAKIQKLITDALNEFMDKTCVQFREKTDDDLYFLRYTYGDGCSSSVGRSGKPGGQDIYLGDGCFNPGTIRHETLHALGFYHEQSRTDRDKYVKILWNNIQPGLEDQFQKSNKREVTDLGSPYDYASVMHYPYNAFANDEKNPTITKIDGSITGFGQRVGFSPIDLYEVNKLYNCPGTGKPPIGVTVKFVGTTQKPPPETAGDGWINRWTNKLKSKANNWLVEHLGNTVGGRLASFISSGGKK